MVEAHQGDVLELRKALRFVEARRGQLLGPAPGQGKRTDLQPLNPSVEVDASNITVNKWRRISALNGELLTQLVQRGGWLPRRLRLARLRRLPRRSSVCAGQGAMSGRQQAADSENGAGPCGRIAKRFAHFCSVGRIAGVSPTSAACKPDRVQRHGHRMSLVTSRVRRNVARPSSKRGMFSFIGSLSRHGGRLLAA